MNGISLTTYYFLYVECRMTREEIYSSLNKKKEVMKTKSKHDLINQLRRIEKLFYSIPDWINDEHYPYMRQMNLAQAIAEDYHNNINNYLGDYPIDDAEEFYRRYDLQVPISVYAAHHSEYTKYLTNKS